MRVTLNNQSNDETNPFLFRGNLTLKLIDKIRLFLLTITLMPIRILGLIVVVFLCWLSMKIALLGVKDDGTPLSKRRLKADSVVAFFAKLMFWLFGLRITIRGRPASRQEARLIVVAPHSSFLDTFVILYATRSGFPSTTIRLQDKGMPIFGVFMRYTQSLFVKRGNVESRHQFTQQLMERINSPDRWPQVLLYPEGTNTNRSCLILFKIGGFAPGIPVQPIVLHYQDEMSPLPWVCGGPEPGYILWRTLTQMSTRCTVEFLPVYHPNDREQRDSRLYADNVRALMANALRLPITDYTFEDFKLMTRAHERGLPWEVGLIGASRLMKQLRIDLKDLEEQLDNFAKLANREDGLIHIDDSDVTINYKDYVIRCTCTSDTDDDVITTMKFNDEKTRSDKQLQRRHSYR